MAETSGRYTLKDHNFDPENPFKDELSVFYLWFDGCKITDRFAELMHKKGYLTEGDIASIVGIESELSNPFRFFCGDRDIWHFDLTTYAKDLSEKRAENKGFAATAAYRQITKQIQQALED